ncbi:hypothetical protein AC249_AIPGENE15234 [Exaiptasia diaphana]|nr:hypothetical protein AC249_AIPGENE15234 [Exaiptasia diaphana]
MDSKFSGQNRLASKRKTSLHEKTHLGIRVMQRNIFEKDKLAKKLQTFETEMQGKMKSIDKDVEMIKDFQRNLEIASPYESETRWLMEIMSKEKMQSPRRKASVPSAWSGGPGYQAFKNTDIDEVEISLDSKTKGVGIANKTLHNINTDLSKQHQTTRVRAKTATEGMLDVFAKSEAQGSRAKAVVRRQTMPKTKKEQISVDNIDNMMQTTDIIHRKLRNINLQEEEDVFTEDMSTSNANSEVKEKSLLSGTKKIGLVYDEKPLFTSRPSNGVKYPVGASARSRRYSTSIVYPRQSQQNVTYDPISKSNQVMRRRLSLSTFVPRPPTDTKEILF